MRKKVKSFFMTFIIFTLFPAIANAGIALGGTRLIYDASEKSAAIDVLNTEQQIYLIQAWVEGADKTPVPFVLTPPLFKINKKSQRSLRIIKTNAQQLPTDKESLYWLNVKAIPFSEDQSSSVQVAVKTRIKLIYRPAGIKQPKPSDIKLVWSVQKAGLMVSNSSPYYITFYSVQFNNKALKTLKVIEPRSSQLIESPDIMPHGVISWKTINDYGAASESTSVTL